MPDEGWSDVIYLTIQLFALNYDDKCAAEHLLNLDIARFLAAILIFFAVIRLLFSRLWVHIKIRVQAILFAEDRHILVGYGALNQEIARERASWAKPLTIVARSFDGAAKDFASQNRAVLVERDIRGGNAFAGLMPHRARRIIVACGDDSLTMETAQQISGALAKRRQGMSPARVRRIDRLRDLLPGMLGFLLPRTLPLEDIVYAHFTSTEMHRQMLLTRELGLKLDRQYSGFAIREETARYLFARSWLAERAMRLGQTRLHVVVVGAGDLGMAITREAVQHGCSADLGPPLVTVIDRDCDLIEAEFRAAMPMLFDKATIPAADRPDLRFVKCAAQAVCDKQAEGGDVPVTGWVLACRDDTTNLTLAMQLEAEMRRGSRPPAPIYPRQWQGNIRDGDKRQIGQGDPLHLVAPFGGMQDVVPTLGLFDDQWRDVAKSIHAVYQSTVKSLEEDAIYQDQVNRYGPPPWQEDEGPADPAEWQAIEAFFAQSRQRYLADWADLPNEARLANLASAQQAAVRLWEMGFDWKGRQSGALPHIDAAYVGQMLNDAALSNLSTDTRLGRVACAEHRRWMVERALRGWAALKDKGRNNPLRLHFDFRRYDDLLAEAQATKARHDAAGKTEPNPQLLDAASIRGIMVALSQVPSNTRARPSTETADLRLAEVDHLSPNISHLVLRVDRLTSAELEAIVAHISKWCAFEAAFSIRLIPQTEQVWADADIKQALTQLVAAARAQDVHVTIDMFDGQDKRDQLVRTA